MPFSPDMEVITREQVRRRLDVGDRTLSRIIAAGHFPPGLGKPPRWYAADCDAYLYLRARGVLVRGEVAEENRKNSSES